MNSLCVVAPTSLDLKVNTKLITISRDPGRWISVKSLSFTTTALGAALMVGMPIWAPPVSADPSWTMPNLIGKDLQGAQDAIQSLTNGQVWYSGSKDLTGKGRNQIVDRNWQVCTSVPPPGATFTTSTSITFGVVRIDTEKCP